MLRLSPNSTLFPFTTLFRSECPEPRLPAGHARPDGVGLAGNARGYQPCESDEFDGRALAAKRLRPAFAAPAGRASRADRAQYWKGAEPASAHLHHGGLNSL